MPPLERSTVMLRRFAVLAASLFSGLVLITPGGAAAAPQPDCFDVDFGQACSSHFEDNFVDTVLCDFPVTVHVDGSIRYRPFPATDGSGNLTAEEQHIVSRATITTPATGRSFFDGSDFNTRATFLPDGSVAIRETGIRHNAVVDDGQRLLHQSGNHSALIDPDDQVT